MGLEKNAVFGGPKRDKEESWGQRKNEATDGGGTWRQETAADGRRKEALRGFGTVAVTIPRGQKIPRSVPPLARPDGVFQCFRDQTRLHQSEAVARSVWPTRCCYAAKRDGLN